MRYLKNFFRSTGIILSYLFPYKVLNFFKAIRVYIFSGYTINQFKATGKDFYILPPLTLIGGQYITIGDNFSCFARLRLEAYDKHLDNVYTPEITIGNNVAINFDCHIACVNYINIGNNVLIASKVFITDHLHGEVNHESLKQSPLDRPAHSKGPVVIADNVWIGEGVVVLPNVTIGENCIIGANSVVTKSFPKNSIIAGVPAKLIKTIQ